MSQIPIVSIPPVLALVLNIALWSGAQILSGYVAHRLPVWRLQQDRGLLHLARFEAGGRWYERTLRIGRWKDRLPEAGAFFDGGVAKRNLLGRSTVALEQFAAETRRAEIAHWASFACLPFCVIWNDVLGLVLMGAYGLVFNLPLIAIQRYNRARIQRIVQRRAEREERAAPGAGRVRGAS